MSIKRILKEIKFNKNNSPVIVTSIIFVLTIYLSLPLTSHEQNPSNDDCLMCHNDKALKVNRGGKMISAYIDEKAYSKTIHSKVACIGCHSDLANKDLPHDKPKKAQCGSCHKEEQGLYNECLHGKSFNRGDQLAPTCQTCHGKHDIVSIKDRKSPVYPINVPKLCGKCHREGSPVQLQRNIPESHILENYSESIHGEGLIKKGLVVSATCASCHSPHRILPHTDPRSTINRKNIAGTCTKCHAAIEFVHKKVINGRLWEKEAKVLPACIDCHQPHKIRKVFYPQNLADDGCKKCHDKLSLKSQNGQTMFVNSHDLGESKHNKIACAQCHVEVNPNHQRSCDAITRKVDCSSCHTQVGDDYMKSYHGQLRNRNNADAPACVDCHGTHRVLGKNDEHSPIFPLNIPKLCSRCHQEGKSATRFYKGTEHKVIDNYAESIHGHGLIQSGLVVTATCTDCHTAHKGLPYKNPESSIHPDNIARTCGNCHYGIQEEFNKSIHSPFVSSVDKKKLPVCNDCHTAHTIKRTDLNQFRLEILNTCGKCHKKISETYFDTYHGKVSRLGSAKAAKCSDCHGSHSILPVSNYKSSLHRDNIVTTCQKCHKNANKGFTKYFTHATHHDSSKYPWLFWTFWGMTLLLLGTFSLSFLHTLIWLPRSFQMRREMKKFMAAHLHDETTKRYSRFSPLERTLHITMIVSFLSLAITGLSVKFSYTGLAKIIAFIFGGVENAGYVHRFAATLLFGIFIIHVIDLFKKKRNEFKSWKDMLFGPFTMIPTKKDLKDVVASFKWYFGKGPRPRYGRWTYWEKFDYFAVFWGIFIIGSTGLSLWFPEIFSYVFPGWLLNVATIVHSDEALLAAGFIFTVHFFNTHFRPEKFPMDTVIFSGQVTVDELKMERPDEYRRMRISGEIEKRLSTPFSPNLLKLLKIFGWIALTTGLSVVLWIIYSMIFAY
ncbi:MAG: hypothetical protein M1419_05200 [Bacteroidetes bacterium]|nr:hypothetical protein [Bacteroidota bacterium]